MKSRPQVLEVVKRTAARRVTVGGAQHSGWLPEGAIQPLPTPKRDVLMDFEIQFDGFGYLLCYRSSDGELHGDTWHENQEEAEQVASELFGVTEEDWSP